MRSRLNDLDSMEAELRFGKAQMGHTSQLIGSFVHIALQHFLLTEMVQCTYQARHEMTRLSGHGFRGAENEQRVRKHPEHGQGQR